MGILMFEMPDSEPKLSTEQTPARSPLGRQRRNEILSLVNEHGAVRSAELTTRFGVSDMTIRRDIAALAEANLVIRVHGGATRSDRFSASAQEPGFSAKSRQRLGQKQLIAARAAERIRPGSAIGITAGTTTYRLMTHLGSIADLTVVTNSLAIAGAVRSTSLPSTHVIITGGSPTPSNAIVGPMAERCLANLHLDQLFMGIHGMSAEAGFTTPNLAEAQTNLAFTAAARDVVVLADSTKWGIVGLGTIAPLTRADVLITDDELSDEARLALDEAVGVLDVVEAGEID